MSSVTLEAYKDKQRQQTKQFKECFNSPAGKEVLKALREEFYDCQMTVGNEQWQLGQRDVVFQILIKMENI